MMIYSKSDRLEELGIEILSILFPNNKLDSLYESVDESKSKNVKRKGLGEYNTRDKWDKRRFKQALINKNRFFLKKTAKTIQKKKSISKKFKGLYAEISVIPEDIMTLVSQDFEYQTTDIDTVLERFKTDKSIKQNIVDKASSLEGGKWLATDKALEHGNTLFWAFKEFNFKKCKGQKISGKTESLTEGFWNRMQSKKGIKTDDLVDQMATKKEFNHCSIKQAINVVRSVLSGIRGFQERGNTAPYGYGFILYSIFLAKATKEITLPEGITKSSIEDALSFFVDAKKYRTLAGEVAFNVVWVLKLNQLGFFNNDFKEIKHADINTLIRSFEYVVDILKGTSKYWDGHKKERDTTSFSRESFAKGNL